MKVVLVDYLSECDENGKPIGHRIKAGNEYCAFLDEDFEAELCADRSVLKFFEAKNKSALKYGIEKGENSKVKKLKYLKNIKEIYRDHPGDVLWFFAPDIYAYIAMLLLKKGRRKIAVTVCEEHAGSRLKHAIFKQALKKADIVFTSNEHYAKYCKNSVTVPDYTYKTEFYSKYLSDKKLERVVCLGTMNEKKLLREAVEAFNKNGYPLYIAGQFASKEKFRQLCKIKAENVIIEDRYIDEDEYYRILGESRYSLLPYDARFYKNRTSGVLQESMFLDTVPIAHESILKFNGIDGVGYKDMAELENIEFDANDFKEYIRDYGEKKEDLYSCEATRYKINKMLYSITKLK